MIISRKKIEYIAHNLIITEHAMERIRERLPKNIDIRVAILNSPFWYRNIDGTINIAIDQNKYFVVNEKNGVFTLITVKNPSALGYDITDKFVIAYMGISRKDKNFNKK